MKRTKRVFAVCILLITVFSIASIAFAGTVGSWNFSPGQSKQRLNARETFTGVTTRTRTGTSNAVVNVQTTSNGYILRENTAAQAWVEFRVLASNGTPATNWLGVFHGTRKLIEYSPSYKGILGEYYIQMFNDNGFSVITRGTWKPDDN